jgi:TPR repeat protein
VLVAAVRYTQAMIYEYPKAFRPLADMYYEGRATSKDLEMAKRLYKKAAKNGDELAQKKYLPRPVSCVVRVCGGACAIAS